MNGELKLRYHEDCIYSKSCGNFGGYTAIGCEKHGNIEALNHPYYSADNCPDYKPCSFLRSSEDD